MLLARRRITTSLQETPYLILNTLGEIRRGPTAHRVSGDPACLNDPRDRSALPGLIGNTVEERSVALFPSRGRSLRAKYIRRLQSSTTTERVLWGASAADGATSRPLERVGKTLQYCSRIRHHALDDVLRRPDLMDKADTLPSQPRHLLPLALGISGRQ